MKKTISASFLALSLLLSGGCAAEPGSDVSTASSDPASSASSSQDGSIDREELVLYDGDRVVDGADFEIFEKYFYGVWVDESGIAPCDLDLTYSGRTFDMGFYGLMDIYTDSERAYRAINAVGETDIYVVDLRSPETLYEYNETNHGGRERAYPDFTYTRIAAEEDGSLGFFGILKLILADQIPAGALTGTVLRTDDGSEWCNYGERLTVIERTDREITLKALCRVKGENPYVLDIGGEPLQSKDITYTIFFEEGDWTIGNCEYASE
ncbi:MAG: hypothetical protein NC084_13355 [Bacteroides sp.]|nr:hypothetical protein [Roseburia sp.]MCM1463684.1 hypothetical protein [Bacteroides sp.]